jgi:hypothetical protein
MREMKNTYRILVGNPPEKRQLGGPGRRQMILKCIFEKRDVKQ